jgi:hypothetical protein
VNAAAMALAERLLRGAACRCGGQVVMSDHAAQQVAQPCRWTLNGNRWQPGCDAPPIHVKGERGDYNAIQAAYAALAPTNRAARRASKRNRGKDRDMKMQITFKSGAQIVVDVETFSTGRSQLTNELTSLNWTTPPSWTAKLHTVTLAEVVAVVAIEPKESDSDAPQGD